MRLLPGGGHQAIGLDAVSGRRTRHVGSICDAAFVAEHLRGADAVLHCATLHKPHIATHPARAFVETNVTGTLTLLEAAITQGVGRFIFTSTTSAFGAALTPPPGQPAAWIDGWVPSQPKNIYGATKTAAEDLCHLFHRRDGLNVIILRTSRFFPEPDDNAVIRDGFADENVKANEFLFRRVDIADAADAHICAMDAASGVGFGRYVISAPTPFQPEDCARLRGFAPAVVQQRVPEYEPIFRKAGFRMFDSIDRVYVNNSAMRDLNWQPEFDFGRVLAQIEQGQPIGSDLSRAVGIKGYHGNEFADGIYPVG